MDTRRRRPQPWPTRRRRLPVRAAGAVRRAARGAGDDRLRALAAVAVVEDIEHVQGVARGAGHHFPAEPRRLVVDHVQPRRAAPAPEVLRVRPGVDRGDGDDEPHAVDRSDQPSAPRLREGDGCLVLDESGVRGLVRCQPRIRLVDVGQRAVLQRVVTADDRRVADVAAVRDQQRGDRHMQVPQAGLAAGDRGERGVGADPREHLQQHLRQVDTGQGIIASTALRRSSRETGSGSGSGAAKCRRRSSSSNTIWEFAGTRAATSRYVPSSSAARAARCSPGSPGSPGRFREARTVGRTCSHASPSSSFARGSSRTTCGPRLAGRTHRTR